MSDLSECFNNSKLYHRDLFKNKKINQKQLSKNSTTSTNASGNLANIMDEPKPRQLNKELQNVSEIYKNEFNKDEKIKVILNKNDNSIRIERFSIPENKNLRNYKSNNLKNKNPLKKNIRKSHFQKNNKVNKICSSKSLINFKNNKLIKNFNLIKKKSKKKLNYSDISTNRKKRINFDFLPKKIIKKSNISKSSNNLQNISIVSQSPISKNKIKSRPSSPFIKSKPIQHKRPSIRNSKRNISTIINRQNKSNRNISNLNQIPCSTSISRKSRGFSRSFNRKKSLTREEQYLQNYSDILIFTKIDNLPKLESEIQNVWVQNYRIILYNYLIKISIHFSNKCYSTTVIRAIGIIDRFISNLIYKKKTTITQQLRVTPTADIENCLLFIYFRQHQFSSFDENGHENSSSRNFVN